MQIPCLIELINLIDLQTRNKAYLPMDVIEKTCTSMLGSSDEAQKHIPTLTRQWLKDKILSELPTVKSARQKDRRKTSVLYCPEACEEDVVYSSMMHTSEMEDNNDIQGSQTGMQQHHKIRWGEGSRHIFSIQHKRRYPCSSLQSDTVDFGRI